jgi:hypothetical protein
MHLNKSAMGVIIFFLAMAFIVPVAEQAHLGMSGIFVAMIAAVALSFAVSWCGRRVRERMLDSGLSRGELVGFLVGYAPEEGPIVEADPAPTGYHNGIETSAYPPLALHAVAAPTRRLSPEDSWFEDEAGGDGENGGEDDLPERILEPNGLYLSDTYQPSVESMLGQTILLCGIRRSGKSNALAVLAEEQARYAVPLVIGDTEDEYAPLADPRYMRRGVLAGSMEGMEESQSRFPTTTYIPIDLDGAYEFGKSVLEESLQVVLNLRSFASDDDAALIMCEIIAGMNDWEQSRPNQSRVPCMFLLDEANKWLPQNVRESYVDKEILDRLQKAFFGTMVRRGGKRGLGLALTTQRIVELDKRALQSTWKFLFRQTEQVDIARYKALGLDGDAVQALRPGECFVYSPGVIGFPMQMRQRSSPHLGHTPGLAQLRAHLQHTHPMNILTAPNTPNAPMPVQAASLPSSSPATVRLGAMTMPIPGTTADHLTMVPPMPPMAPLQPNPQRTLALLERKALSVYQPGMTYRQLGDLLHVGKDKAGEIIKELRKRGLIAEGNEAEEENE